MTAISPCAARREPNPPLGFQSFGLAAFVPYQPPTAVS